MLQQPTFAPSIGLITSAGYYTNNSRILREYGAPASSTWPVNNNAYFIPFFADEEVVISKLFLFVGANTAANIDLGIYDSAYTLLVSTGATAEGTANALQVITIADTLLVPGDYFMAVSLSSTGGSTFRTSFVNDENSDMMGTLVQTSAHPLPNPAAPVLQTANFIHPLMGMYARGTY